jgi:sterol 24-C-methyltransferase
MAALVTTPQQQQQQQQQQHHHHSEMGVDAVSTAVPTTSPLTAPVSDSDSPRSSNTSASNEKIDFSGARRSTSSLKRGNGANVDRTANTKRWKTFRSSFKYLYNLTQKQVDDFMSSYVIYNLDWENEDEMVEKLGPEYQQKVGDSLRAYYGIMNHL